MFRYLRIYKPKVVMHFVSNFIRSLLDKRRILREIINREKYIGYMEEIGSSKIKDDLEKKKRWFERKVKGKTIRGDEYAFGHVNSNELKLLYSLIRNCKPKVVVETGVANGIFTTYILLALEKNKFGRLYSIDFPEMEGKIYKKGIFWGGKGGVVVPKGKKPGWIIPNKLIKRWELILGKSSERLPELLKKLGTIDVFIHDSEHSYECMRFEYKSAYKNLKKGGYLFSHDVSWNKAFFDFCREKGKKPYLIGGNFGFLIK